MELLKEVFKRGVMPALGCTEPIAIAYAASVAMQSLKEIKGVSVLPRIDEIFITLDPGVFKNAAGVCIPRTEGMRGAKIAAALGAIISRPGPKLEVLANVERMDIEAANEILPMVEIECDPEHDSLFISVLIKTDAGEVQVVIQESHTNITTIRIDGRDIKTLDLQKRDDGDVADFHGELRRQTIASLVEIAKKITESDRAYIREGVTMNLALAERGRNLGKFGSTIWAQVQDESDIFLTTKAIVACATDARMSGEDLPAMSSGGSGNQGVITILVPWNVGLKKGVAEATIEESIALSHLLNAYVKQYTGELAPICGCAVSAGLGAAAALAYQMSGGDLRTIGNAINNILGGANGLICDGAKNGCTLKVVSSADFVIMAGLFALDGKTVDENDGVIGNTPEQSIANLGRLCDEGLGLADGTIIRIILSKGRRPKGM